MLDQSKHESTIQPAYIGSSIHQEKWGNILSIRTPTCRVYYWLLTANLLFFNISFPGSFCVLLSLFSRKNPKKNNKKNKKTQEIASQEMHSLSTQNVSTSECKFCICPFIFKFMSHLQISTEESWNQGLYRYVRT